MKSVLDPLLCLERSYSNLRQFQETGPSKYLHHAAMPFVDAISSDHNEKHQLIKCQTLALQKIRHIALHGLLMPSVQQESDKDRDIDAGLICGMLSIDTATILANECAKMNVDSTAHQLLICLTSMTWG